MTTAVIIATADRPESLARTLRALTGCEKPGPGELHVVVADNGSDGETASVCREPYDGLRVEHLKTPPGKSLAQNRGAEATDADLLVFTDDDVEPGRGWLTELERAALGWPRHMLLGGPITPVWPAACPAHLIGSRYGGLLFSLLERDAPTGPLAGFRPFGPNMALRREAFDGGIRFDETIGPGSEGSWMGEDTDIARQVDAAGQFAVYVPAARTLHHIRPEQLSVGWQLRRGVKYGRALSHFEESRVARIFGMPRWALRAVPRHSAQAAWRLACGDRPAAFDALMRTAFAVGRCRRDDTPREPSSSRSAFPMGIGLGHVSGPAEKA